VVADRVVAPAREVVVGPRCISSNADRQPPQAGPGPPDGTSSAPTVDRRPEFQQIFNEGWRNERNNLYVKNLHWHRLAEDEARCTASSCLT
jgi:hypothetical protein